MSYWDRVWTRTSTSGTFGAVHGMASSHSRMLMDTFVLPHVSVGARAICELGAGSGNNSLYLASKLRDPHVTLVDTSAPVLKSATVMYRKASVAMTPLNVDMFSLGEKDGQHDIVHSGGLLEHFDDPASVIVQHLRLTRPGGITFISIPRKCWFWDGFLIVMKLFKKEFTDQVNYTGRQFATFVRQARRDGLPFTVEAFSTDGIDIAITMRRLA